MTEPVKQIEQPFLPRYHVTHFVGEGAAARIYQVTDTSDGSVKAIKALKPQSNAEPSIVKRFEDEYQILRRLHHPSLPDVHDYGFTQDQIRYIVMELVEGVHLDQYFQSNPQDLWLLLYEHCESALSQAQEVPVIRSSERMVVRAKARLGDMNGANRLFGAHFKRLKRSPAIYRTQTLWRIS